MYNYGYYKTHVCNESFICKICGRLVVPTDAGSSHRNHSPLPPFPLEKIEELTDMMAGDGSIK